MKKKIGLATAFFSLLFVIIFLDGILDFIVNIQWFKEVDYLSVYFTKITSTIKLMIPIFIVFYLAIWIYYKSIRHSIMKLSKVIEVDRRKGKVERIIFVISNCIISFFLAYSFAASYWYKVLLFTNSTSFDVKDPIFNMDISFFVFKLPLIESLYSVVMGLLVFMVIITLILYFLLNAKDSLYTLDIKNAFANAKVVKGGLTGFAGKQLATVSALILLLLSIGYVIKTYALVYSPRGAVFGASFTDINVSLMFYRVIAAVSLIAAIVVFVSITTSKVKPIIVSVIVMIVLIIGEGAVSLLVQNLMVKSNQISYEQKYIKYNIDYTRKAFNIDNITEKNYAVNNNLTKEDLINNKDTIDNIKVNSFKPALDFYNQVQVIRYYYGFNDIDIDRYNINGKYSQVFIAPREINSDSIEPNTWQNKHLVYTHGYGVVMSKVNSVTPEGQPNFLIKDLPPENTTDIPLKNPRIYYGEKTNYYTVVNTDINEFDYPKGGDNQVNKYDGKAGIQMSMINRLLFAINKRDINFLLSQDINSNSKILLNRNIVERVNKIAPFLQYDKDPYVIISEGKLYWIIDAYTTSNRYPYSQPNGNINYIRNSVKVVIDAYEGTTNFYIVDKSDPIANSYSKIFKDLFKDVETLSPDIRSHFRYPEDLFNIQSTMLGKYHMTDTKVFLTGEDLWDMALNDKKVEGDKTLNEASFLVTRLPEEKSEELVLMGYFNMRDKESMTAMFAARMDKENYGKLVLYRFPTNQTIYSPYLFKQKINQDTAISKELSLWDAKGSSVTFGDTVVVPIKNSLLYIEPMYLIAQGENSIPEMKRVIVSYGEKIVLAENIEKAMDQLFNISGTAPTTPTKPDTNTGAVEGTDWAKQAKDVFDKAVDAQKKGDWAKYGEYINQLGDILGKVTK